MSKDSKAAARWRQKASKAIWGTLQLLLRTRDALSDLADETLGNFTLVADWFDESDATFDDLLDSLDLADEEYKKQFFDIIETLVALTERVTALEEPVPATGPPDDGLHYDGPWKNYVSPDGRQWFITGRAAEAGLRDANG